MPPRVRTLEARIGVPPLVPAGADPPNGHQRLERHQSGLSHVVCQRRSRSQLRRCNPELRLPGERLGGASHRAMNRRKLFQLERRERDDREERLLPERLPGSNWRNTGVMRQC